MTLSLKKLPLWNTSHFSFHLFWGREITVGVTVSHAFCAIWSHLQLKIVYFEAVFFKKLAFGVLKCTLRNVQDSYFTLSPELEQESPAKGDGHQPSPRFIVYPNAF